MSTQTSQFLMWGIQLPYAWHKEWEKANPGKGGDFDSFYTHFEPFITDNAHDEKMPAQSEPDKHTPWKWVPCEQVLELEMLQATKEFALAFAFRKESHAHYKLAGWKAEAIEVEAQWDCQAIGKLLDVKLGDRIRPHIEPNIRELIADRDRGKQIVQTALDLMAKFCRRQSANTNAGKRPGDSLIDNPHKGEHYPQVQSIMDRMRDHIKRA